MFSLYSFLSCVLKTHTHTKQKRNVTLGNEVKSEEEVLLTIRSTKKLNTTGLITTLKQKH